MFVAALAAVMMSIVRSCPVICSTYAAGPEKEAIQAEASNAIRTAQPSR